MKILKRMREKKFILFIGFLTLNSVLLFGKPISANAADFQIHGVVENPIYKDAITESSPNRSSPRRAGIQASKSVQYETDINKVVASVRAAAKDRKQSTTVYYKMNKIASQTDCKNLANLVVYSALGETGNPDEGDYLRWNFAGCRYILGGSYADGKGNTNIVLTYYFVFNTTAQQEQLVTSRVNDILSSFHFTQNTTDYAKIKAIYDYIISNVKYDHQHVSDSSYRLQFSAYAALYNKTAVCQGYALLLYRMLQEEDINCRLIAGTAFGGAHGWNIVKLKGMYYYADSTWDSTYQTHNYFLKGINHFPNHLSDSSYTTATFRNAYPISAENYSGSLEMEHRWDQGHITQNSTCAQNGIKVYSCSTCGEKKNVAMPKKAHTVVKEPAIAATCARTGRTEGSYCSVCHQILTKQKIIPKRSLPKVNAKIYDKKKNVVYQVTKRGKTVAFKAVKNKKTKAVTIPATIKFSGITYKVTSISPKAFYNCKKLKKITIKSKNIKKIGKNAFKGIYKKAKVKVPKSKLKSYMKLMKKAGLPKKASVKK